MAKNIEDLWLEIEAKELGDFFREFTTMLAQSAAALTVADVTAIGYAFASQRASAFWLGAAIIVVLLVAWIASFKAFVPMYLRSVVLEQQLRQKTGLAIQTTVSLGILSIHGQSTLDALRRMATETDESEQAKSMRQLRQALVFSSMPTRGATLVLALVAGAHIALGIITYLLGWRLF